MARYIEDFGRIIKRKKKTQCVKKSQKQRKTRKRGGGFEGETCDFTPISHSVTGHYLKGIFRQEDYKWNLNGVELGHKNGSFNIVKEVTCKIGGQSQRIVCRISKDVFYKDYIGGFFYGNSIDTVAKNFKKECTEKLNEFANELNIQIELQPASLPIYDLQVIELNHEFFNFLSDKEKIELFELIPKYKRDLPPLYCLCVVMKKGEPYRDTEYNFRKTMKIFSDTGKKGICCMDVKPDNMLCINGEVFMIDFDTRFVKRSTYFHYIQAPELFCTYIMQYLFCMFIIINNLFSDFKLVVIEKLDKLMSKELIQKDGKSHSFMFFISLLYNNNTNLVNPFRAIINGYQLKYFVFPKRIVDMSQIHQFINLRKYIIICEQKSKNERRLLFKNDFTCLYDNKTQTIIYTRVKDGKELINVDFTINLESKVSFSYTIDSEQSEQILKI